MARILLTEDDADVRVVVEHVLLDGGYEVDAAANLESGRKLLFSREYDLVLSDGRLPDGTGMELADAAQEKGIPTLILTGYAFILRELAADPTRYKVLLKPLRPTEILQAVEDALRPESICD
jgi:two-component system response regulator HydG